MSSMYDATGDYTQRCSYCLKKVGKTNLKRCGQCKFVQYCSKECQRAAWPTHKQRCASGGAFKDSLAQPDHKREKKLNDDFTKWLNQYRPLINTSAISAFNLPNSPEDKLATHCVYLIVRRRPNASTVPLSFRMITGQVLTRPQVVRTFRELDLTDEQIAEWARDSAGRAANTVHIIIQFHDMLRFLWFSISDLEGFRGGDKANAARLADTWAEDLSAAIEDGFAGPE